MKVTIGYQYADSDPDEIIKQDGSVEFTEAIDLFHQFPWDQQFEKVARREDENWSYNWPSFYLHKQENHFLEISAKSNDGFSVYYRKENLFGTLFITNDISHLPSNVSVEEFIVFFYENKLEETLEIFDENDPDADTWESNETQPEIKKKDVFRSLYYLLIPLSLTIYFPLGLDLLNLFLTILGIEFVILLVIFPHFYLKWTYWKNHQDLHLQYNTRKKILTVVRAGIKTEIPKHDIIKCEWVRSTEGRGRFQEYSYLKLITGTDSFYITNFTAYHSDLISLLQIHFQTIEVAYPKIPRKPLKNDIPDTKFHSDKYNEFLVTYASLNDDELKEIIRNDHYYAGYARQAAEELLRRKNLQN